MAKTLGITGGIGSGKSYVSTLLQQQFGIPVYDCDAEAKRLTATNEEIRQKLIALVGLEVFEGGELNKPLLAKYLGALPTLKGSETYKTIDFKMADGIRTNVFEKHQETPNAIVLFLYHTPMQYTLKNRITASMLDQIMDITYTESVREDEGGAYGVPVSAGLSRYPQEEATIQIQLPTAPEKREKMTAIVYQGVENMVNNGPKAEDLQKVKEYMLRSHEESLKQNGYWMGEMMNYVLYGEDNDAIYVDTVNGITAADIQEMARQIFKSGNRIEVGMTSPMEDVEKAKENEKSE